jgi:hypothetical protein
MFSVAHSIKTSLSLVLLQRPIRRGWLQVESNTPPMQVMRHWTGEDALSVQCQPGTQKDSVAHLLYIKVLGVTAMSQRSEALLSQ